MNRQNRRFTHKVQLSYRDFNNLNAILEELNEDGDLAVHEVETFQKVKEILRLMEVAHSKRKQQTVGGNSPQ